MSSSIRASFAAAFVAFVAARSLAAASLSGRILDSGAEPVVGARVEWRGFRPMERILLDASRGAEAAVLGSVRTDGEGQFAIRFGKPAGEISIRVLLREGCEVDIEGPFDSTIEDELPDLILPSATGKFSGQVVDEVGRAVSGARVELQLAPRLAEGAMLWKTVTTADGTFRFGAVPMAPISVTVRASSFVVSRADVSLGAAPIRVVLRHGGGVFGTVIDDTGKPVAGAIVVSGTNAAETSREGRFRLEVRAGSASVLAIGPDGRIGRREGIAIRADEDVDLDRLRVLPSACFSGSIIDDSSRQPVASALVTAATMRIGADSDPLEWRTARADGRGRFQLCGLASGTHRLEVEHPGYLPAEMDSVLATIEPADGISVALRRESAVAGRVTDESGVPVPGARVHLHAVSDTRAVTTKDGRFRLRRLEPARNAELEAEKVGFARARRPGLQLKAGASTLVPDLILRHGLRVVGTVVDPSGSPVAGVEVRAASEAEKAKLDSRFGEPPPLPDASSDARGRFELAGLDPGEYRVVLWRDGFADRSVAGLGVKRDGPNQWAPIVLTPGAAIDGLVTTGDGKPIEGAHVTAFLEPGRPRSANSDNQGRFHLEDLAPQHPAELWVSAEGFVPARGRRATPPSANVKVSLTAASMLAGRVEDALTKVPLHAFSLALLPASVLEDHPASEDFRSEEGRFVLNNIAPGQWSVRTSAPGYAPAVFPVGELMAGETREGLVFAVREGCSLSGRVVDPRHRGIAEARLVIHPRDTAGNDDSELYDDPEDPRTSTDGEGRFRLQGLSSGKSKLEVSHQGFQTTTREVDPVSEPSVEVVLESGGSRIAGRLVAGDGRTTMAGEEIDLTGSSRSEIEKTGADGSFAFENLADGSYRIRAAGIKPREVSIVEGRSVEDLVLERMSGALIRGTVAGLPPSRLGLLRVTGIGDGYFAETATDEQGHFVLRDVPAGSVRVGASTRGRPLQFVRRIVEIADGAGEIFVELVFQGSSCASGRVILGGRPVSGVMVVAIAQPVGAESPRAITMTDDRGFYELEGLADGDYQVSIRSVHRSLRIDGDTVVDFELPTGSLRLRVLDAVTSRPLSGAQVRLDGGGDPFSARTAVTDMEGGFDVSDLDEGAHLITVAREGYENATASVIVGSGPTDLAIALKRSGAEN